MMILAPLALAGCKMTDPSAAVKDLRGTPAPDFTLTDLDKQDIRLSAFRGRPIVLAFWAYG